jgi:rRNA maturation endonuclease Nob1
MQNIQTKPLDSEITKKIIVIHMNKSKSKPELKTKKIDKGNTYEIIKKYKIFPKVKEEEPENEVIEDYKEDASKTEFQKRLSHMWFS